MLTVVILTYNEERHIERCLQCVSSIADRVVVIDSYSTDQTIQLAHANGAEVLQNPFVNQSLQFQWGLDHANIATEWVMRLDADEIIEPNLAQEIGRRLPELSDDIVGINLKRKQFFMNRWIKHGGRYPLLLLRIWRHGHGRIENRWMDEHIIVWGGKTLTFEGGFADHNLNDLTFFTDKHNKYATREAIDVLNRKYKLTPLDESLSKNSASFQAKAKRWIKENIYNLLPFWMGPFGYFLFRYVFQLGFLDGKPGLIYHFLQGFWYRFLVGAKVAEFDSAINAIYENGHRIEVLRRLTGFHLESTSRNSEQSGA